jgi:hypothetical protein
MADIKAKIQSKNNVQARTVAVGTPGKLSEMADVDIVKLKMGAVLVYSDEKEQWVAQNELSAQDMEGGHY